MEKMRMPRLMLGANAGLRPAGLRGGVRNDAGQVEKMLGEVKAELLRVGSDVRRTADDALRQAGTAGQLSAETKAAADKLLMEQGRLGEAQAALTAKLDAIETRSTDLEQKVADRLRAAGQRERPKSLGQLVAGHEDVAAFARRGAKGTMRITVQNAITSSLSSAGDLIWSDREEGEIVRIPRRTMTIRALLMQGRTTSNLVEYAKQTTRTNSAAVVSEGVQKPESALVWDQADAAVRTIAHFIHVSRQAMDDAPLLQTEIDGELRYGLDLAEELEILKGDGTGQHLAGLVTEATAYSAPFSVSGATIIDTLRLAMLQASLAEYPADGIVIHPTDWARIELLKDGENRYLFSSPRALSVPTLWGLPVVATQSMDADEFLVGAFATAATIYDRMDTEVLMSSEDRDNFVKNMITVRAEKRLALAVKRPAALVTGDFGNVSD